MLLQSRCAGCDRPGSTLCRTCRFALVGPGGGGSRTGSGPDGVVAALAFSGRARDVVLGFKYRNRRQLAGHLAGLLVNRLVATGVVPGVPVDVVTWAPTSSRRRRRRGFDQAELVARQVARQLGLPCRRLLERQGDAAPQTGRGRAERLAGPAFLARPDVRGRRVLVIDDVVTTGSTLRGADDALRRSGAVDVVRAAVAATPSGVVGRRAAARPAARVAARPATRRSRPAAGSRVVAGPWPGSVPAHAARSMGTSVGKEVSRTGPVTRRRSA